MKKYIAVIAMLFVGVLLVGCKSAVDPVQLVTVDELYLNVGEEVEVAVSVIPVDANYDLEWIVDDQTIAATEGYKIKGLKLGSTKITLRDKRIPSVSKEIMVHVVEKIWPQDKIKAFLGFELASIVEYTYTKVELTETSLTLLIYGMKTPNETVIAYKERLLKQGWVVEGSFDSHAGTLIHEASGYHLHMHNEYLHHGDHIEFVISKDHGEEGFPNDEINEHFGITLPVLPEEIHFSWSHTANDGILLMIDELEDDSIIQWYEKELIKDGWVAAENNNDHHGSYTKLGVSCVISYHSEFSHGHNAIEYTIELAK